MTLQCCFVQGCNGRSLQDCFAQGCIEMNHQYYFGQGCIGKSLRYCFARGCIEMSRQYCHDLIYQEKVDKLLGKVKEYLSDLSDFFGVQSCLLHTLSFYQKNMCSKVTFAHFYAFKVSMLFYDVIGKGTYI